MQSVIDMNRQTDGDTQLDFYESMGHFKTMFPTMEEEVRVTIVYCSVLIGINRAFELSTWSGGTSNYFSNIFSWPNALWHRM